MLCLGWKPSTLRALSTPTMNSVLRKGKTLLFCPARSKSSGSKLKTSTAWSKVLPTSMESSSYVMYSSVPQLNTCLTAFSLPRGSDSSVATSSALVSDTRWSPL